MRRTAWAVAARTTSDSLLTEGRTSSRNARGQELLEQLSAAASPLDAEMRFGGDLLLESGNHPELRNVCAPGSTRERTSLFSVCNALGSADVCTFGIPRAPDP